MEQIFPSYDNMIGRTNKELRLNQNARIIWFTGLSGSGKTTLAAALENRLFEQGFLTMLLDGDNIRAGINSNLGFSTDDRAENLRRIAEVAKLFVDCGIITLCAFVSPEQIHRDMVRSIAGPENFIEIYVSTPLQVCETRDVKGLYAKARSGKLSNFTGIDAPFETPARPDLVLDTTNQPVEILVDRLLNYLLPTLEKSESI